jgi:hypothetical protein
MSEKQNYSEYILQILQLLKIPKFKYGRQIVSLIYALNRASSDKLKLRSLICNKCGVKVKIINNRTDCKCKRYIPIDYEKKDNNSFEPKTTDLS